MLFLFLIHSLSTRAAPISAVEHSITSSSCQDMGHCRTLLGIIWSCVTTIFLCTWVSIHPNIPEPAATIYVKLEEEPSITDPQLTWLEKMKIPFTWLKKLLKLLLAWVKNLPHKIWSSRDKILLFICALLVPEYILAWAIRQFLMAGTIVKENRTLFRFILHAIT
jgi:hypothetical protein